MTRRQRGGARHAEPCGACHIGPVDEVQHGPRDDQRGERERHVDAQEVGQAHHGRRGEPQDPGRGTRTRTEEPSAEHEQQPGTRQPLGERHETRQEEHLIEPPGVAIGAYEIVGEIEPVAGSPGFGVGHDRVREQRRNRAEHLGQRRVLGVHAQVVAHERSDP